MQKNDASPASEGGRDWLYLTHRWAGLIAIPFLLVSIALALGLTHSRVLDAVSDSIYASLPIPQVSLEEPVRPGSWDQTLELAGRAVGKRGQVMTQRDDEVVVVQAFEAHSHDPEVAKSNAHVRVEIDTRTMQIVRITDKTASLVTQAHGIHAIRFFGIPGFSIAMVSALSLLVLLFTGGAIAYRDRKSKKEYDKPSFWHVRAGQAVGIFLLIVALTTLDFEFAIFGSADKSASHPIPAVQLNGPLQAGSLDQARELVRQATGALPRAAFVRDGGNDVKFSEAGDGIGGKSVWMNINTMTINRITDWRNDRQALGFILHDGRWLGGMNAFNINDAVALVLLFLVIGGAAIGWRKRRSTSSREQS